MFKAALFDMDGTIIRIEHVWDKILGAFVGKENVGRFWELRVQAPGKGMASTCYTLRKYFNVKGTNAAIMEAYEKTAERIIIETDIEFIPGFLEFHSMLKNQGVMSCLVTNAPNYALKPIKQKLNLAQFFGDNIYNSCTVNSRFKPDPAVLLYAMEKLQVAPEECMIFEDSLQGIIAAQQAKIKKIIVIKSDTIINDYYDLKQIP